MMSEFQCEFMTVLWDCNEQRAVVALLSERILLICINGSFPFSISWIPKSVYCCSSLWHLLNFGPRCRWANCVFLLFFLRKKEKTFLPLSQALRAVIWQRLDSLWKTAKFTYVCSLMPPRGNKILYWSQIKSDFFARRVRPNFFYSLAACWQINPCLTFICTNKYSG